MKLLLDTHAFIWALADPARLSPDATRAILDPVNRAYVSAVSLWEISMKHALGKLDLDGVGPEELMQVAQVKMGLHFIPLDPGGAASMGSIPRIHGDPFDRMLIHQSIVESYCLISADRQFEAYKTHGLKLLW